MDAMLMNVSIVIKLNEMMVIGMDRKLMNVNIVSGRVIIEMLKKEKKTERGNLRGKKKKENREKKTAGGSSWTVGLKGVIGYYFIKLFN